MGSRMTESQMPTNLETYQELHDYLQDQITITVREINSYTRLYQRTLDDSFSTWDGIEVKLDECWKCYKPVPKDDDFGLCASCKQALADFVEGGDSLTDQPDDDPPHSGGQPEPEVQHESEIGGFTVDWHFADDVAEWRPAG